MLPIEWEALCSAERLALKTAGDVSPLSFTSLWFNVTQGDAFQSNWHHHYFKWAAEQVLQGKAQNVIINTPPGSTKTEFWSVHLPVYCFAKFPRVRILNASYSKNLVDENSTRSRSLVQSAEFMEMHDMEVGKAKMDDWTLERDGKRVHQLFSRSSGGQITGVRGGYMTSGFSGYVMADDWDKPDDMFSGTKRDKSNRRLSNTLRSRRATDKTPMFFVQQRLHENDSTDYLLSGKMGIQIDLHIKIPALIDEDYIDSLPTEDLRKRARACVSGTEKIDGKWSYWPIKESARDLTSLRDSDPYTHASQYMQDPQSLEGGIFESDSFQFYGDDSPLPRIEYRFITADTAQKTGERNDYTVFCEWGYAGGNIYLLNIYRGKINAKKLREVFESFCNSAWAKNAPDIGNLRAIYVEDKSSGTGLIQELEGKLPIEITPLQRNTDKLSRAMDVQPHQLMGKVWLKSGAAENYEFMSEVSGFRADDSHKHDDQTDNMIDAINMAIVQPQTTKAPAGVMIPRRLRR